MMNRLIGRLLIAAAIGHLLVGVMVFREPLVAIFADGFFNAIPHDRVSLRFDREAAFWFLLFSPALFMLAQITNRAVERRDAHILRIIGWNLLGMGVVGVGAMPISGFWILIVLAPLLFKAARQAEASPASLAEARA